MSFDPILLVLILNHLKTTAPTSAGTVFHFSEGTCYEWSGQYSPAMSDNDWAKVLAYHGGAARLSTDRESQRVSFQAVATATRDGMVDVLSKANYLQGLENPNLMVQWTITGVCG